MRLKRHQIVALTFLLVLFSGCSNNSNKSVISESVAQDHSDFQINGSTLSPTDTAITSEKETGISDTSSPELVMPDDGNGYPDKLYTDYFIDERARSLAADINKTREDFSKSNEFIDFKFIVDPEPSAIPEDVQKRTVECVAECMNSGEFDGGGASTDNADGFAENETTQDFVVNGIVAPRFYKGWENDYDGDGAKERYMIVEFPVGESRTVEYGFKCWIASALVFENSKGDMSCIDFIDHRTCLGGCKDIILLDYGKFKQIIFGGMGRMGEWDNVSIHGVVNGENKPLFYGRQQFSKKGCFLSFSGIQGVSAFMIYDTEQNDYRTIWGYPADVNKLKELDTDNAINVPDSFDDSKYFKYFVLGERYVLDSCNYECCKYENGKFTNLGKFGKIVIYPLSRDVDDTDVPFDVDIDYALSISGAEF